MKGEGPEKRRGTFRSWALILFFVLAVLVVLIGQTIEIVQRLGWMTKP